MFSHPALLYHDTDEYVSAILPFITVGLAAGEPVAVAVPDHNGVLLRAALGRASERVQWADMTVVGRNPGRIIPFVLRAFADRYTSRRVRIVGEPIWAGRSEEEYPACAQHEALINLAFVGRAVTILCPYDATRLPKDVLLDAEITHPVVTDGPTTRISAPYAPDAVVRKYNRALAAAPAAGREVRLAGLPGARHQVTAQAAAAGFSAARTAEIALVVTELLSNPIEHDRGVATLRTWFTGGVFHCEVENTGRLTDPLAGRIPAPVRQHRGRGLLLVNHFADLVRTHTGDHGTTIRAYFYR
ncbi:anti-sigma regulatory factor [Lentzea sp. NBRC 105346]|nr:anti-sigma regulatory factor [Lentzea sp. NBRC 105346]